MGEAERPQFLNLTPQMAEKYGVPASSSSVFILPSSTSLRRTSMERGQTRMHQRRKSNIHASCPACFLRRVDNEERRPLVKLRRWQSPRHGPFGKIDTDSAAFTERVGTGRRSNVERQRRRSYGQHCTFHWPTRSSKQRRRDDRHIDTRRLWIEWQTLVAIIRTASSSPCLLRKQSCSLTSADVHQAQSPSPTTNSSRSEENTEDWSGAMTDQRSGRTPSVELRSRARRADNDDGGPPREGSNNSLGQAGEEINGR
jgi:hypothetical protein